MRLIDADELKKAFDFDGNVELECAVVQFGIDEAKTIDAVPVVRCKDCKYISATTIGMKYACWKGASQVWGQTGDHAGDYVCRRIDDPEFYCADGERR